MADSMVQMCKIEPTSEKAAALVKDRAFTHALFAPIIKDLITNYMSETNQ